jgi:hypothetical protein
MVEWVAVEGVWRRPEVVARGRHVVRHHPRRGTHAHATTTHGRALLLLVLQTHEELLVSAHLKQPEGGEAEIEGQEGGRRTCMTPSTPRRSC